MMESLIMKELLATKIQMEQVGFVLKKWEKNW